MNALLLARELKREADHLLFDLGVEDTLKKYGPVIYSGSYALDLMAWRDIDLYLNLDDDPEPIETLCKLVRDFSIRDDALRVVIQHKTHLKYPAFPVGICLGIKLGSDWSKFWKLDIWVVSNAVREQNKANLQQVLDTLTPETKELILDMKQKLMTPAGRTPSMSGYFLYQAVLHEGLRDENKIRSYLREHGVKL